MALVVIRKTAEVIPSLLKDFPNDCNVIIQLAKLVRNLLDGWLDSWLTVLIAENADVNIGLVA